jgi:hypothetical protein
LFWYAFDLLVDEHREQPSGSMALVTYLGFGNQLLSRFESGKSATVGLHKSIFYFDENSNLEEQLKERLCLQGDYCWQPMRDWPGQYEIRVDGVLKPDGSGWDLWSGELTEEQLFPSYSHFVLNTNTNQLHVVVDTGRVTD